MGIGKKPNKIINNKLSFPWKRVKKGQNEPAGQT